VKTRIPGCKPLTDRKCVSAFRVPPMSEKGVCTVTELMPKTRTENRQAEMLEEKHGGGQAAWCNSAGDSKEAALTSGISECWPPR
jgi:hypothetical protein